MEEPTDDPTTEIALTPDPNPVTEIPSKLTLNKNGKPRKQLGPEALEKLAKARAKANALTKQNTLKKLEEKVEKMKVVDEIEEPEAAAAQQVVKKKSKKKPQIIIEQSSDDDDEFETNDRVIFVKRVTRKKKEPVVEPPPVVRQEPPDVPKPKPNPLQRQYDSMFSGAFLNQPRRR